MSPINPACHVASEGGPEEHVHTIPSPPNKRMEVLLFISLSIFFRKLVLRISTGYVSSDEPEKSMYVHVLTLPTYTVCRGKGPTTPWPGVLI